MAVQELYDNLTDVRELAVNTAERHFHVMHHMMKKTSTIWAPLTGVDRNPADQVEVEHIDDARKRYLSETELSPVKGGSRRADVPEGNEGHYRTNLRLRLLVLIAVATVCGAERLFALNRETFSTARD